MINRHPISLKTLLPFLIKNPNILLETDGKRNYIVFSNSTPNQLHWNNRAGQYHSSDIVGGGSSDQFGEFEPDVTFQTFGFTIEKNEVKKRFQYMSR